MVVIDNPMTQNTDWYPYYTKQEKRDSLLNRIQEIDERIETIEEDILEVQNEMAHKSGWESNLEEGIRFTRMQIRDLEAERSELYQELDELG